MFNIGPSASWPVIVLLLLYFVMLTSKPVPTSPRSEYFVFSTAFLNVGVLLIYTAESVLIFFLQLATDGRVKIRNMKH
jgi:hypothetical protein